MASRFIEKNQVFVSIILFVVLFSIVHVSKPALIYNKNGSFREFGVGYRNKTIFPVWVFAIVLGIISYLTVRYYCLSY